MPRKSAETNVEEMVVEHPSLERWRGAVDERLRHIGETIIEIKGDVKSSADTLRDDIRALGRGIRGSIEESDRCGKKDHEGFEARIHALESAYTYARAKVAFFAGVAGILGGGLSSAVFGTIFHKIWP